MNSKILTAFFLAIAFAFAGNANAVGPESSNSPMMAGQDQADQAQMIQAQAQALDQVEGPPAQPQDRDYPGSETGDPAKNQVKTKNQGEENQVQAGEAAKTAGQNKGGSATAQARRSQVANAVQAMLQVADRNGGIGQQVRTIAQSQNQNQEKLEASLQKVQGRGAFAKFFIGADYGEIKKAKKLTEQNREQIEQLSQIAGQLSGQADQQTLASQIEVLEQANLAIEADLGRAQKGFSLLGWMFKLLAK